MTNAVDLVVTVPNGGILEPTYIPDRTTDHASCPSNGCRISGTSGMNTVEISEQLQNRFIFNYCRVPFVVINHLHRKKMDANSEIEEAAQGNAIAEEAWFQFHNFTNYAQTLLQTHFGTIDVSTSAGINISGTRALLIDMQGRIFVSMS